MSSAALFLFRGNKSTGMSVILAFAFMPAAQDPRAHDLTHGTGVSLCVNVGAYRPILEVQTGQSRTKRQQQSQGGDRLGGDLIVRKFKRGAAAVQHLSCPMTPVQRGELRALFEDLDNSVPVRWFKLVVPEKQASLDIWMCLFDRKRDSIHIFMELHNVHIKYCMSCLP
jgi:hypothetical protein